MLINMCKLRRSSHWQAPYCPLMQLLLFAHRCRSPCSQLAREALMLDSSPLPRPWQQKPTTQTESAKARRGGTARDIIIHLVILWNNAPACPCSAQDHCMRGIDVITYLEYSVRISMDKQRFMLPHRSLESFGLGAYVCPE